MFDLFRNENGGENIVVLKKTRPGECGGSDVYDAVGKMRPEKIVMISCNSATAARDARAFADIGYSLDKLTSVDMFPRTGHVETVVLLSRK